MPVTANFLQCLDMLVEHSKYSGATLGENSSRAMERLAGLLHSRIQDVRPTVRRAAMKLTQTFIVRNPIGGDLDLHTAQEAEKEASRQLKHMQKEAEGRQMLASVGTADGRRSQLHFEVDGVYPIKIEVPVMTFQLLALNESAFETLIATCFRSQQHC